MTISIRDKAVEQETRRQATRDGKTLTQVMREALEARDRAHESDIEQRRAAIRQLQTDIAARRTGQPWTNEEFDAVMYGDQDYER